LDSNATKQTIETIEDAAQHLGNHRNDNLIFLLYPKNIVWVPQIKEQHNTPVRDKENWIRIW
jgi:hypothetical protein